MAIVRPELDYDLMEVPGLDGLQIAVIPAMHRSEEEDDVGVRWCDWTLKMDTLFLPRPYIELYGWYAESERETGTDVSNQLFTANRLLHSPLVLVISNGKHLTDLENKMAKGKLIDSVEIKHFVKINGITLPVQVNTFNNCFITGVQQYLDYIIISLRVQRKSVLCTSFNQRGQPCGVGAFSINYSHP